MSKQVAAPVTSETQVSVTDDRGRTLSGMGADVERLEQTMERHAPPETPTGTASATATPTPPAADGALAAQPQQTRGQARYSELTKQRDAAKAEAEAARKELSETLKRLEETRPPVHPSAQQPVSQPPPQPQQPQYTRPEPSVDEIGTRYETYEQFVRDLQRWEIEQYHAQQSVQSYQTIEQIISAREARAQFHSAARAVQDRGRKSYPDFDALLKGPVGQIPMGRNEVESTERAHFIVNHPQSEHVQYAILKDANLAQRLQQADPYTFGQMIAGLVPQTQARPAWTPPPAPPPEVGASSATAQTTAMDVATKGGGFDEYRRKRAQERGVKARY